MSRALERALNRTRVGDTLLSDEPEIMLVGGGAAGAVLTKNAQGGLSWNAPGGLPLPGNPGEALILDNNRQPQWGGNLSGGSF